VFIASRRKAMSRLRVAAEISSALSSVRQLTARRWSGSSAEADDAISLTHGNLANGVARS